MRTDILVCVTLSLVLLLATHAALAVVPDGAEADLVLGRQSADASSIVRPVVAVDSSTQKVFVGDARLNRVLRFDTAASLQNGAAAEAVLGQPDFTSTAPGNGPDHLNGPAALWVDNSGRLWVADSSNCRILRFDHASTIPSGSPANGVLGQVNFYNNSPGTSRNTVSLVAGLVTDAFGNLYVADTTNCRVLRFNNAASLPNGSDAGVVLGQSSFTTGGGGTGSAKFGMPRAVAISPNPVIQGSPVLWVADLPNNRVMLFADAPYITTGAAATRVLGQPGFSQTDMHADASGIPLPVCLAADASGRLYAGGLLGRVVRFDNAIFKASGSPADGVLGQTSFNTLEIGTGPGGISIPTSLALGIGGRLWIGDDSNNRVIRHEYAYTKVNGADADSVLGAASTTTDLTRKFQPGGLAIDPTGGKLFVIDDERNRVLRFSSVQSLASGDAAEAVFGQPDFSSFTPDTAANRLREPQAITVDANGSLWVADTENNRVLRFNHAGQRASGGSADAVFGQADFSSGGEPALSDRSISYPSAIAAGPGGELWVGNYSRLLRFDLAGSKGNNPQANAVLGQPDFQTLDVGITDGRHFSSTGITLDKTGRMWVADSTHLRILRFDSAASKASFAAADGVLGQDGPTTAVDGGLSPDGVSFGYPCAEPGGRLWFSNSGNNRVLRWENAASRPDGTDADGLLGQQDFGFSIPGQGLGQFSTARQMARDATGHLWIADGDNGRILRFSPVIPRLELQVQANSVLTFTCDHLSKGVTYHWQSSPDLHSWHDDGPYTPDVGGQAVFSLPKPAAARWFFRLAEP